MSIQHWFQVIEFQFDLFILQKVTWWSQGHRGQTENPSKSFYIHPHAAWPQWKQQTTTDVHWRKTCRFKLLIVLRHILQDVLVWDTRLKHFKTERSGLDFFKINWIWLFTCFVLWSMTVVVAWYETTASLSACNGYVRLTFLSGFWYHADYYNKHRRHLFFCIIQHTSAIKFPIMSTVLMHKWSIYI